MKVEQGLLYTKDHEWIKVEGDTALVGITDFAQTHLGDIVYVELPEVGDEISKEDSFASVESVKTAADVNMPASGKVEEVNEALNDDPALINNDCYANWMIKISLSDAGELDSLMSPEAYEEFASKEE